MTKILLSPPSTGLTMPTDYLLAVERAGATPVISTLPAYAAEGWDAFAREAVAKADGVVLIGGPDVHPSRYGEELLNDTVKVNAERDEADLALARAALAANKPILAICRGIQVLAVAMGGTLYQDIPAQIDTSIRHSQPHNPQAHTVSVLPGSLLHQVLGTDSLVVTSRHHQSVRGVPAGTAVSATSPDGVIEALEFPDGRPVLGVQWHPETVAASSPAHQALFGWLAREAGRA